MDEVQNVRNPWFLKEYLIEEEEGILRLYYYNGDPEQHLELSYSEDGVDISSSEVSIFNSATLKESLF